MKDNYQLDNFDNARKYVVLAKVNTFGFKNDVITIAYGVTALVCFLAHLQIITYSNTVLHCQKINNVDILLSLLYFHQ